MFFFSYFDYHPSLIFIICFSEYPAYVIRPTYTKDEYCSFSGALWKVANWKFARISLIFDWKRAPELVQGEFQTDFQYMHPGGP